MNKGELVAEVKKLKGQIVVLQECIVVGERLAKAEGYKRGYVAGKRWKQTRYPQPSSLNEWKKKFPMPVSCYGRSYEAKDENELGDLLQNLIEGRLALANRYRVANTPYSRWQQPTVS